MAQCNQFIARTHPQGIDRCGINGEICRVDQLTADPRQCARIAWAESQTNILTKAPEMPLREVDLMDWLDCPLR